MEYIHYPFPKVTHIEDVLPHIDDKSFKVIEKECGNTYINYVRMGPETFPPIIGSPEERLSAVIRRECRGISFNTESGLLSSRPFHKFFNVCENEYLTIPKMGFYMEHHIMDKVDGSMIRPVHTPWGLRWGTKMGVTDTANFAETWLMDKPQYRKFALNCQGKGLTPLFEYYSPENRVVHDYGERNMVLLAVRDNNTGLYHSYQNIVAIGQHYGIPVVELHPGQVDDAERYIAGVKASTTIPEGVVIMWPNGHMGKLKTDAYNVKHRVKEAGRTERTLILAILNSEVDDLLAMLPEEDRKEVDDFIREFWRWTDALALNIATVYSTARETYETKKDFACATTDWRRMERACVFALWDGKAEDADEMARNLIDAALVSETKWEEFRETLGPAAPDFNWEGDDDV